MEQLPPPGNTWSQQETIAYAFKEYELLVENTAMFSDNRQALSSLYISVVNLGFLTGEGYLLLQYFEQSLQLWTLALGLFAIAAITSGVNLIWLRLSEQNRRLLNLRLRYLAELEKHLAQSGSFPAVTISLKSYETRAEDRTDKATFTGRGIYTTEGETLYHPTAKNKPFGFADAEVQVGRLFIATYWVAFSIAGIMYWHSGAPELVALLNPLLSRFGIHI
ncbi:MAG TPA: hypothetical protein VFN78_00475 [Ktedonobacterales bacterium]|nr:hypothetical protein [Ktedonobacterales bacterium]